MEGFHGQGGGFEGDRTRGLSSRAGDRRRGDGGMGMQLRLIFVVQCVVL